MNTWFLTVWLVLPGHNLDRVFTYEFTTQAECHEALSQLQNQMKEKAPENQSWIAACQPLRKT